MKKNKDFEPWTGTCPDCDGSGRVYCDVCDGEGGDDSEVCTACNGDGGMECPHCEGRGEATYHMGKQIDYDPSAGHNDSDSYDSGSSGEVISVYDAADIWASNGKDEDYTFGYSEEELEDSLNS